MGIDVLLITMSDKYTITFNFIAICSYNCKNLKSSVAEIRLLCDNSLGKISV